MGHYHRVDKCSTTWCGLALAMRPSCGAHAPCMPAMGSGHHCNVWPLVRTSGNPCITTIMDIMQCCMLHGCIRMHEYACDALMCIKQLHGATSVDFMEFNNMCMRVHALTIMYGYAIAFVYSRELEPITLYIPCTCAG